VIASVSPELEMEGYDGLVEVSSPGIERPLTKPEHFERYIGREARVRVANHIEGRRNLTGTISRTTKTGFVLRFSDDAEVEVPFGSVTQASLKEDI
jgi:ribosome maturation factor RimP